MTKTEFDRITAAAHTAMNEPMKDIDMPPLSVKRGIILDEETFNILEPFFFSRVRHTYKFELSGLEMSLESHLSQGNIKVNEKRILPFKDEYEHYAFCVDLFNAIEALSLVYKKVPFNELYM